MLIVKLLTVGRYECPPGLAYSQESHTCLWISEVPDCSFKTIPIDETEEFVCPADTPAGAFTKHPHPLDCRQFFLCIGGIPREQGCPLGEVFDAGKILKLPVSQLQHKYFSDWLNHQDPLVLLHCCSVISGSSSKYCTGIVNRQTGRIIIIITAICNRQ